MTDQGNVVSSVYFSDPPISIVSQDGEYVTRFGSMLFDSGSDFQDAETSYRHVRVLGDGSIVSVGVSVPVVEVFKPDGTLESRTDLSDLPLLHSAVSNAEQTSLTEAARTEPAPSRHTIVVKDVAVVDHNLYLLVWDVSNRQKMVFNRLLKLTFDRMGDAFDVDYVELVDMEGTPLQYVWTIAVDGDGSRLLAFDNTPEILFVYDLS